MTDQPTSPSTSGESGSSPAQAALLDFGHVQPKERDERYTPAHVFDALGLRFDLDVCAPPGGVPWVPADAFYTAVDDGLSKPWWGRVWMNPPYSQASPWVRRFIDHGHGIALVGHAKSAWHPELWAAADACAVPFTYWDFVGGSIYMPVWFAAFGDECVNALARVGVVKVPHNGGPIAQCGQCRQATPHPDEHWQFSDDGGWLCPDHASANGGPT